VVRHAGHGPHRTRQASSHAHCVLWVGDDLYVADLGLDAVLQYRLHADGRDVRLVERARCALQPGTGPRHLCATRDGARLYVTGELDNHVTLLRRDSDGTLVADGRWATLPDGFAGRSATSEIALSPDGRWLHVGNRGHDSMLHAVLGADGRVEARQWTPSGGTHPRHFAPWPDGQRVLAANRDSGTLQVIANDAGTWRIAGQASAAVPAPVCVCWWG
jgi:6-phosphogluconolactonase